MYSRGKQLALLKTIRRVFRAPSNKLDYAAQVLGLGEKVRHTGFQMWLDCLARLPESWGLMEKYNKQDVLLTEALYQRLRPWITQHPARALDAAACPACGSEQLQKRGVARSKVLTYQRFQCQACGAWSKGGKALEEKALLTSL